MDEEAAGNLGAHQVSGQFFNEPIDLGGLPELHLQEFEPLDPNYLRIRLIGDAIFAVIVVIAAIVLAFLVPWIVPLGGGAGLLLLILLIARLQRLEVNHLGYLVRDKDFSFRRGIISRNVTTVPFARVQHVSIDRGPLARHFGLATLEVRTAGAGLTVPGMNHETATALKALVVDRAGALADEELADEELANQQPVDDWKPAEYRLPAHDEELW